MTTTTVVIPVNEAAGSIKIRIEGTHLDSCDDGLIAQKLVDEVPCVNTIIAITVITAVTAIDAHIHADEITQAANALDRAHRAAKADSVRRVSGP